MFSFNLLLNFQVFLAGLFWLISIFLIIKQTTNWEKLTELIYIIQ